MSRSRGDRVAHRRGHDAFGHVRRRSHACPCRAASSVSAPSPRSVIEAHPDHTGVRDECRLVRVGHVVDDQARGRRRVSAGDAREIWTNRRRTRHRPARRAGCGRRSRWTSASEIARAARRDRAHERHSPRGARVLRAARLMSARAGPRRTLGGGPGCSGSGAGCPDPGKSLRAGRSGRTS